MYQSQVAVHDPDTQHVIPEVTASLDNSHCKFCLP